MMSRPDEEEQPYSSAAVCGLTTNTKKQIFTLRESGVTKCKLHI